VIRRRRACPSGHAPRKFADAPYIRFSNPIRRSSLEGRGQACPLPEPGLGKFGFPYHPASANP